MFSYSLRNSVGSVFRPKRCLAVSRSSTRFPSPRSTWLLPRGRSWQFAMESCFRQAFFWTANRFPMVGHLSASYAGRSSADWDLWRVVLLPYNLTSSNRWNRHAWSKREGEFSYIRCQLLKVPFHVQQNNIHLLLPGRILF